jgi:hypothetical protein
LFDVSQGHGHHHRQGQANTGLHFRPAADEMPLEAEAVVDAVVDALERAAAVVAASPILRYRRGLPCGVGTKMRRS